MTRAKPSLVMTDQQLAAHWSVSARRVRQLVDERIAVRVGDGNAYDVVRSDAALIAHLRRDEPLARAQRVQIELRNIQAERAIAERDGELVKLEELQRATRA